MSKQKPVFTFLKRVKDITPAYVEGSGRWSNGRTGRVMSVFRGDRVRVVYDPDELNPRTRDFWVPYEFLQWFQSLRRE